MSLGELYAEIMLRGKKAVLSGNEQIDSHLNDPYDNRMGMTLVIRPPKDICKNIANVVNELKEIEPGQYFYPEADFHITLFDIITGREGFTCTTEILNQCESLSNRILINAIPFHIRMQGIVLSEGAIMVKGFYENEMERIRQSLRASIGDYGLSLDERYPVRTAHITIGRFRQKIEHAELLVQAVERFNEVDLGELEVKQAELVCHNWYDSKKELLHTIKIGNVNHNSIKGMKEDGTTM